jgi:hypothetical protein
MKPNENNDVKLLQKMICAVGIISADEFVVT